jgi:dual oxidase maturation factor 1
MKGWFDAFRNDGGPTLYSYSNRTPVTGDVQILTLYLIFFTIFLAFLVIFPGVRKEVSHVSLYVHSWPSQVYSSCITTDGQ